MFKKCSNFIIKVLSISLISTTYVSANVFAAGDVELSTKVGSSIMTAINHIADDFGIKLNSAYGQSGNVDDFIDKMKKLSDMPSMQSVKIEFFCKNPYHINYIKYLFEGMIIPKWREKGKIFSVEFFYDVKQNLQYNHNREN